jgi:hypothetical protein
MESALATEAEYYLHQNKKALAHCMRPFLPLRLFPLTLPVVFPVWGLSDKIFKTQRISIKVQKSDPPNNFSQILYNLPREIRNKI